MFNLGPAGGCAGNGERGSGLALAVIVGAALLTIGAMLVRMGWDASAGSHESYVRVQTGAAAASGASAALAVARQMITNQLAQNILDQGCKTQSITGCLTLGNDTQASSGVRLSTIQSLASQSAASWSSLQSAFTTVFVQVMPVAVLTDPYRTPAVPGYGGLLIQGQLPAGATSVTWRGAFMILPSPNHPITYDTVFRKASIPFEVRAYGWASLDARTGRRVTAQVTAWVTNGLIELTYPACVPYWQPDSICQYPESVNVQLPPQSWLFNDPAVVWGF